MVNGKYILIIGIPMLDMEEEYKYGLMVADMKDIGKEIKLI
jgi:hypothetical protein